MPDKNWQFELEEYIKQGEPGKAEKSEAWQTAIGLQAVDGLNTSDYLLDTAKEHIEGKITIDEAQKRIHSYYEQHSVRTETENETKEADIVSARIAKLLGERAFQFSPAEWLSIHRRLFEGVFGHAGQVRQYNITKKEWVLNGDTVIYADWNSIKETLDYDFSTEKQFSYEGLSVDAAVKHLAKFASDIWQIHPFSEGNTRATAVFMIKYMNWLNKLEQKYGSKAIPNITRIFIAANLIGSVLLLTKGDVVLYYLQFSASAILHGQVWRLISWIFVPSGSISFLQLLFIFCLWTLGDSMESYLGSFRMNVYFFGGFLLYDIVGMLVFAVTHVSINLTMYYILIAMYLMLGLLMPEAEVRLYFVLPIKMKWMVLVYFVMFAYDVYTYMSFGWQIGLAYGSEIVLALINLLVFIYGCKHRLSFRQNMHQKRRKAQFKAQFSEPRPGSGISRHKCYICGRTELSNPELTFRYCSKCTGNKEYCQDHLFTHTHV